MGWLGAAAVGSIQALVTFFSFSSLFLLFLTSLSKPNVLELCTVFLIFLWLAKPKARLAKCLIFAIIVATGETNCQGEMKVGKEEDGKISKFAQPTSRSLKQYLRKETKV